MCNYMDLKHRNRIGMVPYSNGYVLDSNGYVLDSDERTCNGIYLVYIFFLVKE